MFLICEDFYKEVLKILLKKGIIKKEEKIFVAAAGNKDKNKLSHLGFKNIIFSNVDERIRKEDFVPYEWCCQDLENLTFKEEEFDVTLVHHGLHHCASPHRGLLELYRCAKKGVLAYEGLDNLATKIGVLVGISEKYELAAVKNNEFKFGGFRNSNIPNYVYRWNKREIYKTIASFDPKRKPEILFFYGLEIPFKRLFEMKNKIYFIISILSYPFLLFFSFIFYKHLCNRFAFFIKKGNLDKNILPWLRYENGEIYLNKSYIENRYN